MRAEGGTLADVAVVGSGLLDINVGDSGEFGAASEESGDRASGLRSFAAGPIILEWVNVGVGCTSGDSW